MITWSLTVDGLARTALVRPSGSGAKLGIVCLHGHGGHALDFATKFTAKTDVVQVFGQGLPDDDNVTGWIRPDTATFKYTRYNAQGHEDYDYIEALLAKAKAQFPNVTAWCATGFSGGSAILRYLAHDRPVPFKALCLAGNSMGTVQVTNGKFEAFGPLPPMLFWWGTQDDRWDDQPNMTPFEEATAIWAATYGATQTTKKLVSVCGATCERREYSTPNFAVYVMQNVGHKLLNCPDDGTDDRAERFFRGRLGL